MPASVALTALVCLVISVKDGDTLTVRCASTLAPEIQRIRISAIDAPERKQAFGQRSRTQLAHLCLRQQAYIQPVDRDDYGRTVARVRCAGQDVATSQVRAGMAWVYTQYAQGQPQLADLEQQARAQRLGLWAQRRPVAPWEYRHRRKAAR